MTPTLRQFMEAGPGPGGLGLRMAGEAGDADRLVPEPSLNRPGLALTGFFRYFAHRRIQVFGLAEMTYLKSLDAGDRRTRIRKFYARSVPGVVVTRNLRPLPDMVESAAETRTALLRTPLVTGEFLQRAAVIMADLVAPCTRAQGTMVDLMGIGVLLEGAPGIGKSETALSLVARGFSLVSDDVTELRRLSSGTLLATAPEATRYHMDVRGLGIVHVPSLYGVAAVRRSKRLDMIVQLQSCEHGSHGISPAFEAQERDILGIPVPSFITPVAPGRDAAQLVVTAALNYRLRELGHDAVKELDQRLMQQLATQRGQRGD